MSKKLFYLIPNARYFYSHRYELAKDMLAHGYQVYLGTSLIKDTCINFLDQRIKHIQLKFMQRGSLNPLYDCLLTVQLIFFLYRFRPAVIHAVTLRLALVCGLATKFYRPKKIIYNLGGLGFLFTAKAKELSFLPRCYYQTLRFIAKLCFKLLCCSKKVTLVMQNQDDINTLKSLGFINKKTTTCIIPGNGIDPNKYHMEQLPNPTSFCHITFVGRMLQDKGVLELISALKALQHAGYRFKAIFCGSPDPENPSSISHIQLRKWHKEGLIQWLGYRQDVQKIYHDSDIVVLPSYREGLPRTLLEAACAGIALVATDVPGCREIVKNNVTGLLVKPYSSKSLAQALARLINNPKLRYILGSNAKSFVQNNFSNEVIHPQFAKLYEVNT